MFLFVFIFLNIIFLCIYYSKLSGFYTLFGMLALLFIEPAFQKLTDPSLFGNTFLVFGFDRMKTNIVFGVTLLFMIMFPKNKRLLKKDNLFIFVVIIFHLFNVLLSINQQNSLAIFIVGIVVPILFYKALSSVGLIVLNDNNLVLKSVYLSVILFICIGLLMFNNSGLQTSDIGVNRVGGGVWLSNVSTQILAIFFPLVLIKNTDKKLNILRIVCLLLYFVLLIISVSRTALVVYSLMAAIFTLKTKNKFLFIFLGLLGLIIFYYFLVSFLHIDIIEMYSSRFEKSGSLTNTVESDARADVFKEALTSFINSNLFFGNGISTFNLVNNAGYTNAHNIILNMLVERGIIGLGLAFIFFYGIFKRSNYLLRIENIQDDDRKMIECLKIGLIGYLLIGMTGNDLFLNSGFINGWPLCCIIVFLVLIQVKLFKYKNYDTEL